MSMIFLALHPSHTQLPNPRQPDEGHVPQWLISVLLLGPRVSVWGGCSKAKRWWRPAKLELCRPPKLDTRPFSAEYVPSCHPVLFERPCQGTNTCLKTECQIFQQYYIYFDLPLLAMLLLMSRVITMAWASSGQEGTITTCPLFTETSSVMHSMPLSTSYRNLGSSWKMVIKQTLKHSRRNLNIPKPDCARLPLSSEETKYCKRIIINMKVEHVFSNLVLPVNL